MRGVRATAPRAWARAAAGCRSGDRGAPGARRHRGAGRWRRGRRSCLEVELPRAEPAIEVLRRGVRAVREELVGDAACGLQQVGIALEVGEAQQRRAALPGAEEFARAAQREVLARDLEAVVALVDDLQTLARHVRERLVVEQDREAL